MKTTEIISALQSNLSVYGDLDVSFSMSDKKDVIADIDKSEELYFGNDGQEDGSFELNIRNFPY